MRKSVQQQLLDFLRSDGGVHASGNLQRREWKNMNGTLATPRSIVRRLEELTEEGKLNVEYINNHSHYSANMLSVPPKKTPTILEREDGSRVVVFV